MLYNTSYIDLNNSNLEHYTLDTIRHNDGLERLIAIKAHCYPDYENDCWEWPCENTPRILIDNKRLNLSRIVYKTAYDIVPDEMYVVSTCGNKKCLNPAHLTLDTPSNIQKQRIKDVIALTGQKPPRIKLTEEQAGEVVNDPRNHKEIAEEYGLSVGHISCLKTGMYWKMIER